MVNLSEAFRDQEKKGSLETGDLLLDEELAGLHGSLPSRKGLPSNSFTEISGLPGSGKTSFWLNIAVGTLNRGHKVLFVAANYSTFPTSRARQFVEWKSSRFEERIDEVIIEKVEDLLLLRFNPLDYGLVVFEGFDALVKDHWPMPQKQRTFEAIFEIMIPFGRKTCVIATCGCEKYFTLENRSIIAPRSHVTSRLSRNSSKLSGVSKIRVLFYRNSMGYSVLSTGLAIKTSATSVSTFELARHSWSMAFHVLTPKPRTTLPKIYGSQTTAPALANKDQVLKRPMPFNDPTRTPSPLTTNSKAAVEVTVQYTLQRSDLENWSSGKRDHDTIDTTERQTLPSPLSIRPESVKSISRGHDLTLESPGAGRFAIGEETSLHNGTNVGFPTSPDGALITFGEVEESPVKPSSNAIVTLFKENLLSRMNAGKESPLGDATPSHRGPDPDASATLPPRLSIVTGAKSDDNDAHGSGIQEVDGIRFVPNSQCD